MKFRADMPDAERKEVVGLIESFKRIGHIIDDNDKELLLIVKMYRELIQRIDEAIAVNGQTRKRYDRTAKQLIGKMKKYRVPE